jgi:invasion protein IalB
MRATMTSRHALAVLALALPLALPATAQDAAPAEDAGPAPDAAEGAAEPAPGAAPEAPVTPAPEAEAADPEAGPDAGLSLGEPVDEAATAPAGEPQPGETYIRDTFGAWNQRCLRAEEGPDPCQLYQLLNDAEGNPVAEISLFPLPEGGEATAGATIVTPLETLLTEDLTLSVDGAATRRYPFTFCNAAGCVARVGFTAEEVRQFRAGDQATLRLVPAAAPDQEVVLTISLAGFTAGFDAQQTQPAE